MRSMRARRSYRTAPLRVLSGNSRTVRQRVVLIVYVFDDAGKHRLTLTATDDSGDTVQATEYIEVTEESDTDSTDSTEPGSDPSPSPPERDGKTTDQESSPTETAAANGPRFGFVETAVSTEAARTARWRYADRDGGV